MPSVSSPVCSCHCGLNILGTCSRPYYSRRPTSRDRWSPSFSSGSMHCPFSWTSDLFPEICCLILHVCPRSIKRTRARGTFLLWYAGPTGLGLILRMPPYWAIVWVSGWNGLKALRGWEFRSNFCCLAVSNEIMANSSSGETFYLFWLAWLLVTILLVLSPEGLKENVETMCHRQKVL